MNDINISRRQFIKSAALLAGSTLIPGSTGILTAKGLKRTATDPIILGKTGLTLSRLGFGTGTNSGEVQRAPGTEGFNRLLRYAYDRGVTFIDTAEGYKTHTWIRAAIKGLDRDRLFIQTKMSGIPEKPLEVLDRFRQELGVDYIDSLLIHCKIHGDWDEKHKGLMDAFEEAKMKQIIRCHGVSCHSLPALAKAASLDWVDVNLVRINPQGVKIDTNVPTYFDASDTTHVAPVLEQIKIMHENKHGVIGMKIIGEGDFTSRDDREKSIRFAMQPGLVHAVVIGFKSTAEIDEAIATMNRALAES